MTAILVCGGALSAAFLRQTVQEYKDAVLFAVDGGLTVVHEAGLVPAYLVGDFDTVEGCLVEQYAPQCKVLRHKPEKDATDTELAIDAAMEQGAEEIVLLGATGSRMDHTLANVHMLFHVMKQGGRACILDENNRMTLHETSFTVRKDRLFGNYVSFLPFFGEAKGVCLSGLKYPLSGQTLTAGSSLGISNEAVSEQIEVSFTQGYLLMIEARD